LLSLSLLFIFSQKKNVSITAEIGKAFYYILASKEEPPSVVKEKTIYVDNQLSEDCLGTYSVLKRDCSGNDGDAYRYIVQAANVAQAGDTVYIREGVYGRNHGKNYNDVLWPKNSGTRKNLIVFKSYPGEKAVLANYDNGSYPNDSSLVCKNGVPDGVLDSGRISIARGVISLYRVSHIVIEDLVVEDVAAWVFARESSYITINNVNFREATWDIKGGARFYYTDHLRITNSTFYKSRYDALVLQATDYSVIENNYFEGAEHAVLAIRCGSYNVIRNNYFKNPIQKLVEVYDCKVQNSECESDGDAVNPAWTDPPQYDSAQHNLFEGNFFSYIPYASGKGGQPSAMQFSGQNNIIRKNIFSNPVNVTDTSSYPLSDKNPGSGGRALSFRWGGSWEGWKCYEDNCKIGGEGHEAGFVYGNRVYNNVFNGYDTGQVGVSDESATDSFPTYAPMKMVENYEDYPFSYTWIFEDNVLKNNIFYEGNFSPHINWTYYEKLSGTPVQALIPGGKNIPYFENNNFFATGKYNDLSPREGYPYEKATDWLIYSHGLYPYLGARPPEFFNSNHPDKFSGNIQKNPDFKNPEGEDFDLSDNSEMIDAGAFLTRTASSGSGRTLQVEDAKYFYDGFGISGEVGDTIQLEGQSQSARITDIDYNANTITVDKSLNWDAGAGVSLEYSGYAPDIGVSESEGEPPVVRECSRDSDCSTRGPGFFCNSDSQCGWKPPIGIPKPEFGIEETYRMYDDPANRNPELTYTKNSEGGYYTHYVDNSGDCHNPESVTDFGSPSDPLCNFPQTSETSLLPPGSIVEIHGDVYDGGGRGWRRIGSGGTEQYPVFVRGYSENDKPLFTGYGNSLRIGGTYLIIENIQVNNSLVFHKDFTTHDYISVRNVEITGAGSGISMGKTNYSVFYNNYIHDTAADFKGDTDVPSGGVGIMVGSYSNHVWVSDNHVHGTGSDSFHSGHGGVDIRYVYVGRNEFHHDKENAIDIKAVKDFIISQNKVYGYRDSCSSGADAIRVNDEGDQDNIWIIFNEIYDSDVGIAPYSATFRPYIIGNIIYDTPSKAINDNGNTSKGGSTVVYNTFYDTGIAINKVKECNNNIISSANTPIVGDCNEHNNILDESLVNMPEFCERINYFEYYTDSAVLTNTGNSTTISVSDVDFEDMGIEYDDRVSVEYIPEVAYNSETCPNGCFAGGTSTRPFCAWQRVGSISGDTITLKPSVSPYSDNIACPDTTSVSGVNIRIWY